MSHATGRTLLAALGALLCAGALASPAPASIGIESFDTALRQQNGDPATQAGSRPHTYTTEFFLETAGLGGEATQSLKDAAVDLPPGLLGNPTAVPACSKADFEGAGPADTPFAPLATLSACPFDTAVGHVKVWSSDGAGGRQVPGTIGYLPLFNLRPPPGVAALFGFNINGVHIYLSAELRTDGDYGATIVSRNTPQTLNTVDLSLVGFTATIWGVPADPAHDAERGYELVFLSKGCVTPGASCDNPSTAPLRPFLTLPTACPGQPLGTTLRADSWEFPGEFTSVASLAGATEGCDQLDFAPTLKARPTTNVADSPTGLEVDLHIPQNEGLCDPGPPLDCENATSHLKEATVTLPEGLTINPSGANGLGGCSAAQIGMITPVGATPPRFSKGPAACPDAAKVATVEVDTPLLDHPATGAVYIAQPYENPFNSLLAIYLVIDDSAQSGTVVKLAGHVVPDPNTGRLTTTFAENPQVPFEHFKLNFKQGAHAQLKTPQTCGDYSTTSSLTPWSGAAPATPQDDYAISQGPGGGCANSPAALPNSPGFAAGTVSPISKNYSPFVLHLRREDGSQNFSAITLTPPPGLVAKLAGTATCSDGALAAAAAKSGRDEQSSPSCPLTSRIGSVDAAAGAGPSPYHASGTAYLAGPYKGAPLSLAIVTPAVAGPFDLGTIVIRTALHVDPKTAQITAVSDPIPAILQGIPTNVKSADVVLDKPDFTLTGTSCDPSAVNGLLTSTLGAVANLSNRFQLSDCGRLAFKPRISLRLKGKTKRGGHPQLTVVLRPRPGDANIASLSLAMPRSEFLENAHIRTICTRPDFAADNCPKGAVYGRSTVYTPLLDYPLIGNVYLRSSDNLLPDLVPDLRGPAHQPIKLEAASRTDSIRGGIRSTLDFVPDAPFSRAVVKLQGGNKGLLVNSRDICKRTYRAKVKYTAHNGRTYVDHPKLQAKCKKRKGKRRGHKRKGKRGAKGSAVARRGAVR